MIRPQKPVACGCAFQRFQSAAPCVPNLSVSSGVYSWSPDALLFAIEVSIAAGVMVTCWYSLRPRPAAAWAGTSHSPDQSQSATTTPTHMHMHMPPWSCWASASWWAHGHGRAAAAPAASVAAASAAMAGCLLLCCVPHMHLCEHMPPGHTDTNLATQQTHASGCCSTGMHTVLLPAALPMLQPLHPLC